jgi:hypothetical protein
MMLMVEAHDKTIDKRCIEQGFKYLETLRDKLVECNMSCKGVNYLIQRGKNQHQEKIKKTNWK